MTVSSLFDLIDIQLIGKWRKEIESADEYGYLRRQQNERNILTAELNEKQKKLLQSYALSIENSMDYIYYGINTQLLNLGIKIGMELQTAFNKEEE